MKRIKAPSVTALALAAAASIGAPAIDAQVTGLDEPGAATSSTDWDRLGWTAASLDRLLAEADYPSMLLISALARNAEALSAATLSQLSPVITALSGSPPADSAGSESSPIEEGLRACRRESDATRGVLCSMERLVPVVPAPLARDVTEEGARLVASLAAAPRVGALGLGGQRAASALGADPLQAFAEQALDGAWRRREAAAAAPADESRGLDDVLGGILGFAPTEGASALARAPALARLVSDYPLPSEPAVGAPAAAIDQGYQAFLGGVTGSLGSALRGGANESGAGTAVAALGRSRIATREWAAGRSYVYLATRAAALAGIDGDASRRMHAVGTAAVDLRRDAASFSSTLAGMGRGLALAALSGNVLGFASRITSFFHGAPLSLGGSAGRDIAMLREGMDSLRNEMRGEFAEVDGRFDTLLGVVDESFARLQALVEASDRDLRSELAAVHDEVLALGDRLERMDAGTRSYLQAGFDRDYSRSLVRCLEHRARYVPPWDEMEFGVFSDCLADFRTRAVVDATDALLADRSTPVDDASLATALARVSPADLAYRLPLLARVAEQRFGYAGMGWSRDIGNLAEWMAATSAYLTLLEEWPEHARGVNARDLEAIRSVGAILRRGLGAITMEPSTGGPSPLLERVLAYYGQQLGALVAEADSLAWRHRQQVLLQADPATLFTRMRDGHGEGPSLDVPDFVAAAVPAELRTAALLGVDDIEIVYVVEREDSVMRSDTRHSFLFFGRRHDRFTYTRASVALEIRSAALGTVGVHRARSSFVLSRTEEMNGDHASDDVRNRVDHVADLVAHFHGSWWPELVSDPARWKQETVGHDVLLPLEERIERELRRHATAGLDGVFDAICAPALRSSALSPRDRTSATRMREALTGLSASRSLIEAYARLAFPDALASPTGLHDALLGEDAILDRGSLCNDVASGDSGLRIVWLEEEPARRLDLLRNGVHDMLQAVSTSGAPTLIDGVMEVLDSAIRVQRLRARIATAR